jgi:peptidoglycan-N-acetylglucosamine deacetylase
MLPRKAIALVGSAVMLAGGAFVGPMTAPASAASCPKGLVALTFDDGPRSLITPRLITVLRDRRAPATFFVVGNRVRTSPAVVKRASNLGFGIANHTYAHEDLRRLSDAGIRSTLQRTTQAIRGAGARPSNLMRPPYGSIDARVRRVVAGAGLVPVLWTADPRDWSGRSAGAIVSSSLSQLRPHAPNVLLLHDGVGNSAATLAAVPRIISGARARGYCLAKLDGRGRPTLGGTATAPTPAAPAQTSPPLPRVRVSDASATERVGGSTMAFTLSLDRAAARRTSVRVRTVAVTARPRTDYVGVDQRVYFPAGTRSRVVRVRVLDDLVPEPTERFRLVLTRARGLVIADARGIGTILDNDTAPPPQTG